MRRALRISLAVALLGAAGAGTWWLTRPPPISPADAIDRRADYQAPALLERAWQLHPASTFPHPPIGQPNVSACGPTSVVNAAQALGQPSVTLEGLTGDEAKCFRGFCLGGFTLEQLATLTSRHVSGWQVTVIRPASALELREQLRAPAVKGQVVIANFTRAPLFGRGGGHHSPLGGLLEPEDLVFVLDVNSSYGPWLVPTERLFEAIDTVDPGSGEKRGLLILEQAHPIGR